jgi:hypothetical protein
LTAPARSSKKHFIGSLRPSQRRRERDRALILPVGADSARPPGCGEIASKCTSYTRRLTEASLRAALRREIHAPQEVLEARVRAQRVERGVHFKEAHLGIMKAVGFLQPSNGLRFLAQAGVNGGENVG